MATQYRFNGYPNEEVTIVSWETPDPTTPPHQLLTTSPPQHLFATLVHEEATLSHAPDRICGLRDSVQRSTGDVSTPPDQRYHAPGRPKSECSELSGSRLPTAMEHGLRGETIVHLEFLETQGRGFVHCHCPLIASLSSKTRSAAWRCNSEVGDTGDADVAEDRVYQPNCMRCDQLAFGGTESPCRGCGAIAYETASVGPASPSGRADGGPGGCVLAHGVTEPMKPCGVTQPKVDSKKLEEFMSEDDNESDEHNKNVRLSLGGSTEPTADEVTLTASTDPEEHSRIPRNEKVGGY